MHDRWISFWRLPLLRHLRLLALRRLSLAHGGRMPGTPIVRHYWARFLDAHRADVRGRALEIGSPDTVRAYGSDRVTSAEALDLARHSDAVQVVGDLSRGEGFPDGRYDCFIVPFTYHVIHDIEGALYHSIRLLKPGGVLLANFTCNDYYFPRGLDMGTGGSMWVHWWFTPIQVENLLRGAGLGPADFQVTIYGNLFARIAYQANLMTEELTATELDTVDVAHPVLICVRVTRPADWSCPPPPPKSTWTPGGIAPRMDPVRGHFVS